MNIPKVGGGKYILITASLETGVVLNNDGSYFLGEGENYFHIVNSQVEAFDIAEKRILNDKNIEVIVYDDQAKFIKIFRPNKS